jgi:hypothetical protein
MATDKQIAANRRNALQSTGPRTPLGKAQSRLNSIRHGLLSKAMADPGFVAGARTLAIKIAREHGQSDHCVEAHIVAEAELTILQARAIRARLLDTSLSERGNATNEGHCSLDGFDENSVVATAEDNHLASTYLAQLPTLSRLDRYEKTALLRRQRALRSLCPAG